MDTRNVIAAISLSAAVIILYSLFFQPDPATIKKVPINFNYSYLVIAKITMLNNEYAIIKDTLFQDIEKIK